MKYSLLILIVLVSACGAQVPQNVSGKSIAIHTGTTYTCACDQLLACAQENNMSQEDFSEAQGRCGQ